MPSTREIYEMMEPEALGNLRSALERDIKRATLELDEVERRRRKSISTAQQSIHLINIILKEKEKKCDVIGEHLHYLQLLQDLASIMQPEVRNAIVFAIKCIEERQEGQDAAKEAK